MTLEYECLTGPAEDEIVLLRGLRSGGNKMLDEGAAIIKDIGTGIYGRFALHNMPVIRSYAVPDASPPPMTSAPGIALNCLEDVQQEQLTQPRRTRACSLPRLGPGRGRVVLCCLVANIEGIEAKTAVDAILFWMLHGRVVN